MATDAPASRITYGGYLQLEELLALQDGPEGYSPPPSNDELHFIIVHQTFELWFKLILRELKEARQLMNQEHIAEASIPQVVHHLERVSEIFRLLADQWKVMETLSPQDSNRGRCENSRCCSVWTTNNGLGAWIHSTT
jgi:tryptophan 2,3-dioxygenase